LVLRTKILFVSSVPEDKNYIDVGQESDTISEVLGIMRQDSKFQFIHKHGIIRGKFREILQDYKPDIIHFSGHGGEKEGLVFQDNEEISKEMLRDIFDGLHNIQLIYLNACYSAKQTDALKNLTNVKNIIGMNKSIADYIAIQFSTNFYKNYKRIEMIKDSFTDTFNNFRQEYPDIINLPELVKIDEKIEINDSLHNHSDEIDLKKRSSRRLVQNRQISIDLLSQIEQSIKIFDEKVVKNEIEPEKFWKGETSVNLSKILIILDSYSEEYGLSDIELKILRSNFRTAENLFHTLTFKSNSTQLESKEIMQGKMIKCYEDIIKVLRKLLFNYKLDSIQKIQPLFPQDSSRNILSDTSYKIQSLSISLNTLKNKILQSILRNDDPLVQSNSKAEYFNILFHLKIEYNNFLKFMEKEFDPNIAERNVNFTNLFSNLNDQLILDRVNTIALYESLNNIYDIQGELGKIFETCVVFLDNINRKMKSRISNYESGNR